MRRYLTAMVCLLGLYSVPPLFAENMDPTRQVADTRGLIAFWDFEKQHRGVWRSYFDPTAVDRSFPVYLKQIGDDRRYTLTEWPYRDGISSLTYDRSGPFGRAVRFNMGYIYGEVPREEFDRSPLDIRSKKPFTLIVWVKFTGKRHMVAGIWDEGGWDRYAGQRQIALFSGIFGQRGVIAHISATGAASFPQSNADGSEYARLRAIDAQAFENDEWVAMAMTYDPDNSEVRAYLNGKMTQLRLADPVTEDVFKHKVIPLSNPFRFEYPIYSPHSFLVKYNGYDFHRSGIKEHRLSVALDEGYIEYQQAGKQVNDRKKIAFDVLRKDKSILRRPISQIMSHAQKVPLLFSTPVRNGDVVVTSLYEPKKGALRRVGTEIRHEIKGGAPFTFGRAPGLGSEEMESGSVLFIDGVAIFDRVLSGEELAAISFVPGK